MALIKKYGDLTSPIYHYHGTVKTRFSPSTWTHFIEREDGSLDRLDGVTKVVHVIDKSEALIHWAVALAVVRARKLIIERGLGPDGAITLFVSELDAILAEAKRQHKDKLDYLQEFHLVQLEYFLGHQLVLLVPLHLLP